MFLFQKGQAIDNCYTVVFPHKENAYAETCRVELLPQWLVLPIFGKSHCSRGYHRVFGKQNLDVLNESVCRIDGIEPIGDVAEVGIEFIRMNVPVRNPRQRCSSWQNRHNRETAIPNTCMVGAFVTQNGDTGQPTAQNEILRQAKISCYKIFCRVVRIVRIEFRQSAECQDFKRFPSRRKLWSVVFGKMFCDEIFLRPLDFPTYMCYIRQETCRVFTEAFISKPKRAVFCSKIANHLAACGYFYLQNSMKDDLFQICIEVIDINYITEMGIRFETMTFSVNLQRSPVVGETEIACPVKNGYGFSLVINNKPSLLQSFNLLSEGKSLFGIFHSKKAKSRPVALPNRGRVPGSIGRKDTDLLRNLLIFYRKSA